MGENQIPEDIRRFLLISCPSVPHLEALLLLRSDAPRIWNGSEMAARLYVDEQSALNVLRELASSGLAAVDDAATGYHYAPSSTNVAQLVDRLCELHARALVTLTHLIHGRSAQLFADAFRFRKD